MKRSTKKLTNEEFIYRAKEIHGDKYDYSKVEYVNNRTKVCIICPEHGEFWQTPKNHLIGDKCPICGNVQISLKKKKTTEQWVKESMNIHGSDYDYSKSEYISSKDKICIICPIHGEFWIIANDHLQGRGCPKCRKRKNNYSNKKHRAKTIDKGLFEEMVNNKFGKNNVTIIEYCGFTKNALLKCNKQDDNNKEHGLFYVKPSDFLLEKRKTICPKCLKEYRHKHNVSNTDTFIRKAKKIHGDRYDYSKVQYYNTTTPVLITCREIGDNGIIHGEFLQTPQNHLANRGCPKCKNEVYAYEKNIYYLLLSIFDDKDIIRQYRDKKLLGKLTLDFYIPKYKIAIEHQGSQHFKTTTYFGDEKKLAKIKENDIKKYNILKKEGIAVLYFSYEKYTVPKDYFTKVYIDIEEFVNKIKEIKEKYEKNCSI